MFEEISPAPPDAILGLTEAFKEDSNPDKINLGVGVYQDEEGETPVLSSVKKAERAFLEGERSKSYLPISGSAAYAREVQELLWGEGHALLEAGRVATAQTPGGTGGLRVGGELIKRFRPGASIWLSDPTWANHQAVFAAAGLETKVYPYYDAEARGLNFEGMLEALKGVPAGDAVLLHVCCHNPTGADPDEGQWIRIAEAAAEGGWFPFFDFAYQGFGAGLEADRGPLGLFAEKGLEYAVSSSCSKNFGLYNERTGAFSLVAGDAKGASAAMSHVKKVIRANYSNPPRHGSAVVETILGSEELRGEWKKELEEMRNRIHHLRKALAEGLAARGVKQDFEFITRQQGMFSFSGLTKEQVHRLRAEYSIYLVDSGRINVAGLNKRSLPLLCDAVANVLGR